MIFSLLALAMMRVLHSRHCLRLRFLFLQLGDLVVKVGRQDAQECHHSLREAAPSRTQPIGLRLSDHFIHRHHGTLHKRILGETRHAVGIFADLWRRDRTVPAVRHPWHSLHWPVADRLLTGRPHTEASAKAWPVFLRRGISLLLNPH